MSLNDVLTRDVLKRVLEMPGIAERLRPGMPENWESEGSGGVEEVIQSPQFQQVAPYISGDIDLRHFHPSRRQSAQDSWLHYYNNSVWRGKSIMWRLF